MAADIMRSADFRSIVEPILSEAFDGIYDLRDDEWQQFAVTEEGIKRAYQEEPVISGLGPAQLMLEGTPVTYDSGQTFYIKRYMYDVYGLAFALTKVLVEDGDHIRIGTTFSKHLAQSMAETEETVMANNLNRAFNGAFVGGDNVSLCNASHPTINSTYSNVLATPASLSQASVEQMLIQIRKAVNDRNFPIHLRDQRLIISPDNIMQAEVIVKSVLRSGVANNDINPVKTTDSLPKGIGVVTRLTSTTAWFIKTNAPDGLKRVNRRSITRTMEGDFETDSMRYKATMRFGNGWTNPRTVYGTAGV